MLQVHVPLKKLRYYKIWTVSSPFTPRMETFLSEGGTKTNILIQQKNNETNKIFKYVSAVKKN